MSANLSHHPTATANREVKLYKLTAHFNRKLFGLGLDPWSLEGCALALKYILSATDRDWEDIGIAAGLKSRPRTTIGLLKRDFEQRLKAAGG